MSRDDQGTGRVPAALRSAARTVTDTESRQAAANQAVSVLEDTVGVEHACVYLQNDAPEVLFCSARTDAFEADFDVETTVEDPGGPVAEAIETGQPVAGAVPEDPPASMGLADAGGWVLVPLGGEGVLVAVTPDDGGLDDDVVAAVDLVGAYLEGALASHAERPELPSDARIAALSKAFPDYAFVYDADGRYVDVLLGETNIQLYRRQELLGSTVEEVMDDDVAEMVRGAIDEALSTGEMQVLEYGVDTPGGVYWYESRAVPVEDGPDGETVVFVARDITERYEREQTLQHQNERLEEFASIVSHDLRNPLNVASLHVELAQETGDIDHLEEVDDAHERMEALIGDLLTLAREGRTVEDPDRVPLEDVAVEAWNGVDTDDASLSVEGDATLLADRSQLRQLFENLFRNAVEHGSTSPQQAEDAVEHGSTSPQQAGDAVEHGGDDVAVRVETLADGFAVEDDGPGVPPGEREAVFDPGHTTGGGAGLGLNIVQSVVEAHGWSIEIVDPEHDGGARFAVTGVEQADDPPM